jgi:HIRAN domain-containing protein
VRHFFASVAGESYPNRDGTDRQAIIASCRVGEALVLDAEPDNPVEENAVRMLRRDGQQIGYLEHGMAARLVDDLSEFTAFVAGIGQGGGGPYLGVSLLIVDNDGQDAAAVAAYARAVLEGRLRNQLKRRARRVALILAVVLLVALAVWWCFR